MRMNDKIVCIMGPTGSGKSALSLELAKIMPCEIISVDSAIVYRGMDIGTAKPSKEERGVVPHHLIDIRDPAEKYSAAEFCQNAHKLIQEIQSRNRTPLLVGGTMLYFKALQEGLSDMPSADKKIREKISNEAKEIGWSKLHERLSGVDPEAAKKIHANDAQRIQRALEVYELTGKPISALQNRSAIDNSLPKMINLALGGIDRKILHDRIEKRFDEMLNRGLVEEVKKLYNRGDLNPDLPSMRAVGYRQVWQYLSGEIDYEIMREKAIAATRQLAKRQLTWLKSWPDLHWVDGLSAEAVLDIIEVSENI